jgi:alanine-glyoxylate transaminase/serine-glyoxylate transaminase/serine-pyruvate transaminase
MISNPRIPGHRFLHSPGPTHIPPEVIEAMSRQPIDHGDPRLDVIIAACERGLKSLLNTTSSDVFMYAANGHGAWEACIANLLAPGQKVLICGTGHFSESWAVQTEALGATVVRTPWVEGYPIDPQVVEAALRADINHEIVAVFTVHTDTASGMTNDLHAIRAAIDSAKHPALFVVDVVASLGATLFEMDALRANVVIGASQKGLMCSPGLGFCAVDETALAVARRNPNPRYYWDWVRRKSDVSYYKFCGTAPQNLLMGLAVSFDLIAQEGVGEVFARHARIARATQAAVNHWSQAGALALFCKVPAALSTSITAISVAAGIDVEGFRTVAREQFQVAFAGGLGPMTGRVFRIGHLGSMNPAMILGCLAGIEAAMTLQKVPFTPGGVQAAVASLTN